MEPPLDGPALGLLLLTYSFLVKAAVDCPRPVGNENTVMTTETLLMNEFPNGIEVSMECANGYVRERGSDIIMCMNGKWSELELTCTKKDCGLPKPETHMSFDISGGTLFGDTIKAICDRGYQIRGPGYKTCYSSGWRGRPRCEITTCEVPAEVTNGRSSWDSEVDPEYGERIHYSCNEGYTLVGNATIVCSENSEYDSPPPECEGTTTKRMIITTMETHSTTATPVQGTTTKDMIITTMETHSTTATPVQEASTSTDLSATPTAHRDDTTSAPSVSPSARGTENDPNKLDEQAVKEETRQPPRAGFATEDITTNKMVTQSTRTPSVKGGRDFTAGESDRATTASVISKTPSSFQDQTEEAVWYIIKVIIITIAVIAGLFVIVSAVFIFRHMLKKRGSYDTKEDLKPELLQFQNL
ncbi:hypothetical protein Q5P01_001295 [Channa striata]|uniref:Sushi domain-containing protein n=1 Tax=Channa striata TaxID=64152 RepID=A0AA88NMJ6_CHASR|nr:hypothetical protein Q5P01_001295 [Channa striata]